MVCSLPCSGSVGMCAGRGCVLLKGCQERVPWDLHSSRQVKTALGETKHNTSCRNLRELLWFCCRIRYFCSRNSRTVSNGWLQKKKCHLFLNLPGSSTGGFAQMSTQVSSLGSKNSTNQINKTKKTFKDKVHFHCMFLSSSTAYRYSFLPKKDF